MFGQWELLQAVVSVLLACSHHSLNASLHSGKKKQENTKMKKFHTYLVPVVLSLLQSGTRHFLEHRDLVEHGV